MIRVKNRTRKPITLPAPYQGILSGYREEVIDTTAAEFITAIGGLDTARGLFDIVALPSTETATVTVDRTITDTDLMTLVDSATGYASTQRIEVTTIGDVATVVLTKDSGGEDIDEDVTYTIKDVGGNASTNNITISCSSTFVDSSASTYVIETDYASIGVYKSSVTGRFVVLPGVSSGGGSSTPTQEYLSSAAVAITAIVDTVLVQKSSAPCTVTLPAITAALDGNITSIKMEIADAAGAAGTHTITIQPNAGDTGTLINGSATATITADNGAVTLQAVNYGGITYGGGHDESRTGKHWKLS